MTTHGNARIVVDADRVLGPISPYIFGQNLEPATCKKLVWKGSPLSDRNGVRKDVLQAIRDRIRVPMLRWPGGNFASQYRWKDGVGPVSDRPVTYDLAWRSREDNFFGTNEFLHFCQQVGAEPFITVNSGSGTAQEAAQWVEYCNLGSDPIVDARESGIVPWHLEPDAAVAASQYRALRVVHGAPKPYDVRYWSIGNETWGDFQTGNMTAVANALASAEFAKTMRQVDPRLRITGVGMYLSNIWRFFESQPHTSSLDWNLELLKTAGEWIDTVSVHRYFFREVGDAFSGEPFSGEHYRALVACPVYSERKLAVVISTINAVMGHLTRSEPIRISFDEWDFGSRTLAHGLATARFFNVLIRMAGWVPIACGEQWIAQVHDSGLLHEASHLAFEMYERYIGEESLQADVSCELYDTRIEEYRGATFKSPPLPFTDVPVLDAAASISMSRKKFFLAIVNTDENDVVDCELLLRNIKVKPGGILHELNAANILSENTTTNPDTIAITDSSLHSEGPLAHVQISPHAAAIIELDIE